MKQNKHFKPKTVPECLCMTAHIIQRLAFSTIDSFNKCFILQLSVLSQPDQLILILPDQVCSYIDKHTEVTKHSHNGSYLKNFNMQLMGTISINTLISLCMLNLAITSKFMKNWASSTGPSQVLSNSSGQGTSVMHCYPDLQKAQNRMIVTNSKRRPFTELSLGVTIFPGKQSGTGHWWAE